MDETKNFTSVNKHELMGEIMTEFIGLRRKMHSFWKDDKKAPKNKKLCQKNVKSSLMTVNIAENMKWQQN